MATVPKCQRCGSTRMSRVNGKCDDCFTSCVGRGPDKQGYPDMKSGISQDHGYMEFSYCIDCGQIQGKWPRPKLAIERLYEREGHTREGEDA